MSEQPISPAPEATTPAAEAPKPTEPAAAAPEAPKADTKPNVWEDPEAAKAEIERLRKENGASRTNAKQLHEMSRAQLEHQIALTEGLKDSPWRTGHLARLRKALRTAK